MQHQFIKTFLAARLAWIRCNPSTERRLVAAGSGGGG